MKNLLVLLPVLATFASFASPNSDSAQFYFSKGMEAKSAKRFMVAAQHFEKALSFDRSYIQAYIENGYTQMEMRKNDVAKANFIKAYELQPSNKSAIKELCTLYFDSRQWNKAIEFAGKCTDCPDAHRIIGISSLEKEDYVRAEKSLLRAITLFPDDAKALYALAHTYIEMEYEKKAIPFFERAVSITPVKNTWVYELGLLYYSTDDFKNAARLFETAATNGYPETNDFTENYGYALLYSGQFAKGEEKLMAVYEKKPGTKNITRDLAQVLHEQKQYERSLVYCQKLLEANPNDGPALYVAGLNFQKMGQKEKGEAMCNKAISIDPSLASKRKKIEGLGGDF